MVTRFSRYTGMKTSSTRHSRGSLNHSQLAMPIPCSYVDADRADHLLAGDAGGDEGGADEPPGHAVAAEEVAVGRLGPLPPRHHPDRRHQEQGANDNGHVDGIEHCWSVSSAGPGGPRFTAKGLDHAPPQAARNRCATASISSSEASIEMPKADPNPASTTPTLRLIDRRRMSSVRG